MGVVGFLVRAGLRRRLGSLLVLSALLGVAGGAVLGAWAGARRTDTAYPRLLDRTDSHDVAVSAPTGLAAFDPEVVRDAPGAERVAIAYGYGAMALLADGTPQFEAGYYFMAAADEIGLREISRPVLLEGRMPDADDPAEVLVNDVSRDLGNGVGATVDVCLFEFETIEAYPQPAGEPTPSEIERFVEEVCAVQHFEVVGVGRFVDEVGLGEVNEGQAAIWATPGLVSTAGLSPSYSVAAVDLGSAADVAAFDDYVRSRVDPAAGVQVQSVAVRALVIERTMSPYVRALTVFALVAAATSIAVLGPALARWAATRQEDRVALLAAGVRPAQLRLAAALRGAAAGAVGAGIAVTIAVLVSPRFPVGPVRRAEPLGGIRVDLPVLAIGVVGLVVVAALLGASAPIGVGPRRARTSVLAERLASLGAGAPAVVGVRAALARGRSGAGPVATAAGVTVAVAAVLAALAYQSGLVRMLDSPERFGWTWDASYESFEGELDEGVLEFLTEDELVDAASIGHRAPITINGESVPAFGFEELRAVVRPEIVDGRMPTGGSEIALGSQTLDRLGLGLGDPVVVRGSEHDGSTATVVGVTRLPIFSSADDLTVGEGALVDLEMLTALGGAERGFVLVEMAGDSNDVELRAALIERGLLDGTTGAVLGPRYTADLAGYDSVRWTPLLLAGLLALLGTGVLAHTLFSSAAAERRQLAVLKCLGFDRDDVAATVRWHAIAVVVACLCLAVPVGLAVGRTLWTSFAEGLGVAGDALTPTWSVLAVVVAALGLAVGLAIVPGRRAASVRPAIALRAE